MIVPVHLVMMFGPPAVGKMAVGRELSTLTGYPLFHNHMSIEPILDVFPWAHPRSSDWQASCAAGSSRKQSWRSFQG